MSWKRFWNVFKQDLVSNWKRPLLWVLLIIVAFMSRNFSTHSMIDVKAFYNSEFAVAFHMTFMVAIIYAFFLTAAAGLVIIADDEHKTGELLHATPLRAGEYIWGKFAAVIATFLLVLVLNVLLSMFFFHVIPSAEHAEMRGPWRLSAYLRPAFFMVLPNLVFLCGLSFAIGERTRKPILVFALPIALFLLYAFFLWDWSPAWLSLTWNRMLQWLDPSGQRWFVETWTKVDRGAAFYNTGKIGFDGPFLLSRLTFMVMGLGAVAWSHWRFRKEIRGRHANSKEVDAALALDSQEPATAVPGARSFKEMAMSSGRVGLLRGLVTVARLELLSAA
jgi:ABC-2 type transport system permease protein